MAVWVLPTNGAGLAVAAVFTNPGIPSHCTMEIRDRLDARRGYVKAVVTVSRRQDSNGPYYAVTSREGDDYANEMRLNYGDLTSAFEKRTDLRSGSVIELYERIDNNHVHFVNREKKIDRLFSTRDSNIYTRFAYFLSFSGFPFGTKADVSFKTYMSEYGDTLTMRLRNLGRTRVTVPAGSFDCYKLELSVGGWQAMFARDRFYLYFDAAMPHHFVRYDEKDGDRWYSNELISYTEE